MAIYETDTDLEYTYNGTSWIPTARLGAPATYTPTLTQSGTVTKTTNIANYWKLGRRVDVELHLTCTGAGGGSTVITVGTPDTMVNSGASKLAIGSGGVLDASASTGTWYSGFVFPLSSTTVGISVHNSLGDLGATNGPAFTLASSDQITMSFRYYSTT